jgi:hypothetical protein
MLAKLHFCGLQGTVAHFFTSYLTDGNQRPEIKWSNDTQKFFSDCGRVSHRTF